MIKRTFLTAFLVFGCILAYSSSARSQDQAWRRVEALRSRTSIIIETKNGQTIKGKFAGLSPTDLNLAKGSKNVVIAKNDIDRIYLGRRRSLMTRIAVGALIGLGVGTTAGVIATVATKSDGLAAAAGVLYGIPIGAVVGAATGSRKHKGELLYLAN